MSEVGPERPSFEAVVRAHRARVFRYCVALTGDRARAEDLLQETFVDAMRGYGGFRGDASVLSWLFTIARRRCGRMARRRQGQPAQTEELMTLGLEAGWGSCAEVEAKLDAQTSRARIDRALATLSPSDREIITLRELDELSTKQVAALLGASETAVRVRLHRARLRFVARLRDQEETSNA